MGWTKRQFVEKAFSEIGFASYAYDLEPEQLQDALLSLDSIMASWDALGIKLGYQVAADPDDSSLDTVTAVPVSANLAVYSNLACELAGPLGKIVRPTTKKAARVGYTALLAKVAKPNERQLPDDMPVGAGTKYWRNRQPFLESEEDSLGADNNGTIEFT